MGVRERRERQKIELRSKILDAARTLFAAQGYEAVSMRRIAETIEYSPTAIYVHFADKESLIRELCREDFGVLAGVFRDLAAIEDPVARIGRVGEVYVEFGARYPNHYRLMFMTAKPIRELDEKDRAIHGQPDEDAYAFLRQAVREAIAQDRLLPGVKPDADLIAQTLWACAHGVVGLQLTHADDQWIPLRALKERTRLMTEATHRGLFGPPPAKPTRNRARKSGVK